MYLQVEEAKPVALSQDVESTKYRAIAALAVVEIKF